MMALLLIVVSSHLAFWFWRARPGVLQRLALDSARLVDGMAQPGDGDEKLEALERQTAQVLVTFLLFIGWALVGVAIMVSLPGLWDVAMGTDEGLATFAHWKGLLAMSVGGTLGWVYPKGKAGTSAYSAMNQLVHRIVLDNGHVQRWLHDREVNRWRKRGGQAETKFLLVTGLARAGTTSLLQRLMETDAFSSLHYGHMPLVMAPGTWSRWNKPKVSELKERSHGDGILVGATSAEALEEPFWRLQTEEGYVRAEALVPHVVSEEAHAAYLDFQGLVRKEGTLYLAKNNNALLRYAGLREHNRDFRVVLMFREPLAHAASLRAMHRRYTAMQAEDPFVKTYMDWLAHHEFGEGHKPFRFADRQEERNALGSNPDGLEYWLDRWMDYYEHALTVDPHGVLFVSHEMWSGRPQEVLAAVMEEVGAEGECPELEPHTRKRKVEETVDGERQRRAEALYGRLMERALHLD